jgi:hypothetical protein
MYQSGARLAGGFHGFRLGQGWSSVATAEIAKASGAAVLAIIKAS